MSQVGGIFASGTRKGMAAQPRNGPTRGKAPTSYAGYMHLFEHFVVFVEELFCFNKHVVIILILLRLNSFDSIVAKFCFSSL